MDHSPERSNPSKEKSSHPTHQLLNFHNFSADLLLVLFENLDATTGVCLGLTCRVLWTLLKTIHPDRIPLTCSTKLGAHPSGKDNSVFLYGLLGDWVGPRYTLFPRPWRSSVTGFCIHSQWGHFPPMFLNADTYGSSGIHDLDKPEYVCRRGELVARWKDYKLSKSLLPRPFGMGMEWYVEARDLIMNDSLREVDYDAWERFWGRTHVFWYVQDEERWRWFVRRCG